jgi:peptide/nickel transport system permease protein
VLIAGVIGWAIGIVSAYLGGLVDLLLQRVIDAMMAFPTILLALALIAALGRSEKNVTIAIALVIAPNVARIVRASTLTVREEMFVLAARSVGVSDVRIMVRHITPNIVGPLIVVATVALGGAVISEASLSFLGLGTPPPDPTWGSMIGGTARYKLEQAPWLIWAPGAAITLTVLATNVLGDSLRDRLDPKLRRR